MSRSRNWQFTVCDEAQHAIITKQVKEHPLDNVTFIQLCKDKGLVVMKSKVRASTIRKFLSVTDLEPVAAPKDVRNRMGEVTFSYGKLLNVYEKKLANKATNYAEAVQNFAKTVLVPEEHPKFELVYAVIASAETIDEGRLKVLEYLPLCKHLIEPAVKRFKLKKDHNSHAQKKEDSKNIVWKPWQQELLEELGSKPDDRKIIWYYDKVGNTGKTFFAKWRYQLDKYTAVVQGGNAKDIYHIISKRTDDTKTVIIDMSRCSEFMIDYNLIENVKNGYFQSGKYNSQFVSMPSPHLVVFANFKPDIEKLSEDRWDIRILSKNQPKQFCTRTETSDLYKAIQCTSHNKYFCGSCCPIHPDSVSCKCRCARHRILNCENGQCKKDEQGKKICIKCHKCVVQDRCLKYCSDCTSESHKCKFVCQKLCMKCMQSPFKEGCQRYCSTCVERYPHHNCNETCYKTQHPL